MMTPEWMTDQSQGWRTSERCWRNENSRAFCHRLGNGQTGLCDIHRAEMQGWSQEPSK